MSPLPDPDQPHPVGGPEPDAVRALMQTSRLVTAVVARSLVDAQATVTTPQLRVLVLLSSSGSTNLTTLARQLGVNSSNASRVCEQLVGTGLLTRRSSPDDRRQVVLTLTEEGDALVESLMTHRRELFASVTAAMSGPGRDQLTSGLTAFLEAADRLADTHDLLAPSRASGGLLNWLA